MKMRIWLINHHALPPDQAGGTRHFDLAKELTLRGHEVTIIASCFHYADHRSFRAIRWYRLSGRECIEGVKFVWLKTLPYKANNFQRLVSYLLFSFSLPLSARQLPKPDVIVGSTVHPHAAHSASRMAKKLKVPFIFEIRDLWPQTFLDLGLWRENSLKTKLYRKLERDTLWASDHVITLSPLTSGYLQNTYGWTKCTLIPNGSRLPQRTAWTSPLAEQLALLKKQGRFVITYTGALIISNTLDVVLKAAKALQKRGSSVHLLLVGKGQDESRLRNEALRLGLDNLSFIKPIPKTEVHELLSSSDALLLIQGRVFYGSQNKLADYLAAGRPLAVSVEAAHNNPLGKAKCGLECSNTQPEAMADTLDALSLLSDNEKTSMGQAARGLAESRYSLRKNGQILAQLLKSLIKKQPNSVNRGEPLG